MKNLPWWRRLRGWLAELAFRSAGRLDPVYDGWLDTPNGGEISISREELVDAFTFWMIEAEHHDFRPIQPTPEEYGVQAADHLLRLLHLERTG